MAYETDQLVTYSTIPAAWKVGGTAQSNQSFSPPHIQSVIAALLSVKVLPGVVRF